jgi:hypothetical protein
LTQLFAHLAHFSGDFFGRLRVACLASQQNSGGDEGGFECHGNVPFSF